MLVDKLLTSLFEGQSHHLLEEPMAAWLGSSRRFTAFVTAYHAKIRKKLHTAQDKDSLLDLELELETAYLLLGERALSLEYEPPHRDHTRRPDFAVTFTTRLTFMVEVTRLQPYPNRSTPPGQSVLSNRPSIAERLADTACGKLGQLMPQRSNILLVGVEAPQPARAEVRAAMLRIQQLAERNDGPFLKQHRFRDRAEFFRQYQRLSEILVRAPRSQPGAPTIVWVNSQAKHALPSQVRTVLYRSQGA